MPWRCGMMLRLQFNNRVALSSCNRPISFIPAATMAVKLIVLRMQTIETLDTPASSVHCIPDQRKTTIQEII
jgi:hypothetical protein